ncbi:MAG: OmpA family protein [Dysgonamonadaceae bacterium]|jgi:outer membrane protein OmpA-like peptidoglycan-associated protein|nr:OmpA family protein [Dysgonamonadaceae bacterium]
MKYLLKIAAFFTVLILSNQTLPAQRKHYIDLWGGAGYSSIFHGIDNSTATGGFGYKVGLGYHFEYNAFMFQLGGEFQGFNSTTKLNSYAEDHLVPYPYIADYNIAYHYTLNGYKEKHSVGYIHFPLKFGFKFLERYYALAGVGVGVNLFGNYRSSTMLDITATDPVFMEDWHNMPTHALGSKALTDNGKLDFGLSISPGLEVGIILDEWIYANQIRNMKKSKDAKLPPYSFRVGIFVDYDLANLNHSATDKKLLAGLNPDEKLNGLLASSLAGEKHVGSLLAGVKFTVSFKVAESKRKPKPQPPLFCVQVNDSASDTPMAASVILSPDKASKRIIINKRTNALTGIYAQKLRTGNYFLKVAEKDYYTFADSVIHTETPDAIFVCLAKIPYLYVDAIDAESGYPINAEIQIGKAGSPALLTVVTDSLDEDIKRYELEEGKYNYSATAPGYVHQQSSFVHQTGDTLIVVMETVKPEVRVLKNLFFKWNSAVLEPESEPALNELHQFISENPEIHIRIIGHTDNTGPNAYNIKLSIARAQAVVNWLIGKDIPADRLESEGKGETEPVDSNDTEEGRANNRRVEFVIQ